MASQATITPQAQKARSCASMYGSRVTSLAEGASQAITKKIIESKQIIHDAVSLSDLLLHSLTVDKTEREKTLESLKDISAFVLDRIDQKNRNDKMISDSLKNLIVALE